MKLASALPILALLFLAQAADAQPSKQQALAAAPPKEPTANTTEFPTQILKTGINLNAPGLSPNSLQLANSVQLTPLLERMQTLRAQIGSDNSQPTLESLATREELYDVREKAASIIQKTALEIDFTIAAINAEQELYEEILNTFTSNRDKAVARTNAMGFIANGTLWAICEAFAIPSYKHARYAIPSGIIGIPAGVVPSIASMYTFKQMSGKKTTSEIEPNMLAKLFDYPTNPDIEYPRSVWDFLHQVPATEPNGKTRLDQMIDRWVADANMPAFTDRHSKKQLDVLTASFAQKKGLSIGTLTARNVMLQQLEAEVSKMKRLLLELAMAAQNEKQLISTVDGSAPETQPSLR